MGEREKCECCESDARASISLVEDTFIDPPRLYIPNKYTRKCAKDGTAPNQIREVWFCDSCMRKIEDNLRATVTYLQDEHRRLTEKNI